MASAQKRTRYGTTIWVARWRDATGQDRSKQPFERKRDALAYAYEQEQTDQPADVARQRATLTVADWAARWKRQVAARVRAGTLAPRTGEGYERELRNHVVPDLGHLLLADLRVGDVDTWVTGKLEAGYSRASVKQYRAVLSALLTAAQRAGLVDTNVAQASEPPPPKQDADDPSTFTPDEVDRLAAAARDHRMGIVVLLGLATGLRSSELAGLKWDAVDLDGGTLQVVETRKRIAATAEGVAPTGVVQDRPKNRGSRRTIPLADSTVGLLRRHKAAQAQEALAAERWAGNGHVITSSAGTPVEPRQIGRALGEIMDAADVERDGQVVHELRRTWATRLRDAGVPLEDVMRLGGWSTPDVLLRLYAGRPSARLAAAADVAAAHLD